MTAMQEFIEIIKKRQEDDDAIPFMYNERIIKLAESMIEKEKDQIVKAHYQGYRDTIGTTEVSENYYKQTYGGNK